MDWLHAPDLGWRQVWIYAAANPHLQTNATTLHRNLVQIITCNNFGADLGHFYNILVDPSNCLE